MGEFVLLFVIAAALIITVLFAAVAVHFNKENTLFDGINIVVAVAVALWVGLGDLPIEKSCGVRHANCTIQKVCEE